MVDVSGMKYLIAYRQFRPHWYQEDQKDAWKFNPNKLITREAASMLAKPGHRKCNGKGYLHWSNPQGSEYIVFCSCSIRNHVLFSNL